MNLSSIKLWFDNDAGRIDASKEINWVRCIPFILLHLSILLGVYIPFSFAGLVLCLFSYLIRMFAITAFFHRYFSHKTFNTSKIIEIFFALCGTSSAQRGPIWWASHHRSHHNHSDTEADVHSPKHKGFLQSHMLWFMTNKNFHARTDNVHDLEKKKHLKLIDRYDGILPLLYLVMLGLLGYICQHFTTINLTSFSAMYWGFSISTVLVLHATFSINSLGHIFGKKSYNTQDESRNNWLLAIITLGEGWHNNHHYWPISARQGFKWYQIDISYYILFLMHKLGLIHNIKNVPQTKIDQNKIN